MIKRNVVFYGNCQTKVYETVFNTSPAFLDACAVIAVPPIHQLQEHHYPGVRDALSRADVFVYQPIGSRFAEFSTEAVLRHLPPHALRITLPVAYFTGYTPETVYLFDAHSRPVDSLFPYYHDINVLRAFDLGKSETFAFEMLSNPELTPGSEILGNLQATLQTLETREREQEVDIPISGFIREYFRERKLFHTFNHPSNEMLAYVIGKLAEALEIPSPGLPGTELLGSSRLYLHPGVRDALALTLADEGIMLLQETVTLREYVSRAYATYAQNREMITHTFRHLDKIDNPFLRVRMQSNLN